MADSPSSRSEFSQCVGLDLQIRTTNTNIDNGSQLLASVALPLAAADQPAEFLHVREDVIDTALDAHDILAINLHVPGLALETNVPQRSVVDSTLLGEVDLLTAKHGLTLLLHASLLGKLGQQVEGAIGEEVLGEVEEDVGRLARGGDGSGQGEVAGVLLEALGIGSKGLLEHEALTNSVAVLLELAPSGKTAGLRHFDSLSRCCVQEILYGSVYRQ